MLPTTFQPTASESTCTRSTAAQPPSPHLDLIRTAQAMNATGLNQGTAGNLSVRHAQGFLITPSGMAYDTLTPADLPEMDLQGQWQGSCQPSSEWRLHRDIYARYPEAGAVLHAHSPFATSLACLRRDIPPFHYMIARFGGDSIRCSAYALFGTEALSVTALEALQGRTACLLANHGMLIYAPDLPRVLRFACELEALCEQYWRALQVGSPIILTPKEMAEVQAAFATYGQQPAQAKAPHT